ncbi:hypothetical protein BGX27_004480 [Mortierella sp. AM989]|nr:hypothetical protein BGX27_004480 [Mortierella sp. AM989]
MSNPGTPGGAGASGSGFQPGHYAQPINTFSNTGAPTFISNANPITTGTTGMSKASGSSVSQLGGSTSAPLTSTPAGTAPRKQLAAAAAAGAAATANKSGRVKAPYKKGTPAGTGKRGGRGGGSGGVGGGGGGGGGAGRGGGRLSAAPTGGDGGGDDGANGGKDSDDDNEDEPEVSIEEQFILRLPPGEMCDRFREKVIAREVDESTKLRFVDARRGTFTFEGLEFPTKLVDLPTIIEAQKTLNGKQMYKIADISQMLLVDPTPVDKVPEVKTEPTVPTVSTSGAGINGPSTLPPLKLSDYIWPDGLTNPLKNVRKRRFRKRVSKVAVEGVENEVERLLKEDSAAEEVQYEIREQIDGMDRYDSDDGATPAPEGAHSDMDMDGEMMDMDEEEDEDEDDDFLLAELERQIGAGENTSDDEGDGDEDGGTPQPQASKGAAVKPGLGVGTSSGGSIGGISGIEGANINNKIKSGIAPAAAGSSASSAAATTSAAAKLNIKSKGKSNQAGDDDEDDEGEDDEEDEDEEEDEEDDDDEDSESEDEDEDEGDKESAQMEKLLKDEIKELNGKVKENEEKLQSAPNDILKRRFGTILEKLRKELELKTMQLEEAKEQSKSKGK